MNSSSGTLFLVATPIGNLGDFSSRAIETLKAAHCIYSEDTRVFHTLAKRFGIESHVKSLHDHNEEFRSTEILAELSEGKNICLVSDAGTPTVSDPGFRVVRAIRAAGGNVSIIPGANAAIAALAISGLEPDRFQFLGFPPQKGLKRTRWIENLLNASLTSIAYESPFRIKSFLETIVSVHPERKVFIVRELTKLYEESFFGTAQAVLENIASRSLKGEFVIVVERAKEE
jgi:16S rRNA (cytidine1402-2'-O)-methyltransferase